MGKKQWPCDLPTTRSTQFGCDLYYTDEDGETAKKHVTVNTDVQGDNDADAVRKGNAEAWQQIREAQEEVGGATTANFTIDRLTINGRQVW